MILDPRSGMKDPGPGILDPGSRILDLGSGILDPGSCIQDPGFRILDSESRILNPRFWVQASIEKDKLPNKKTASTIVYVTIASPHEDRTSGRARGSSSGHHEKSPTQTGAGRGEEARQSSV